MRLPFSRVLTWLYLEGKSERDILDQLDELSLPTLEPQDLAVFAKEAQDLPLSPGTRRRLAKRLYDRQDLMVMEKLGYAELYCRYTRNFEAYPKAEQAWEDVTKLLKNPVARIAVDVGILCKYRSDELSQILPSSFHENISETALDLYCKCFFEFKTLTRADWRVYLNLCSEIPYAYTRYHAALTKAKEEALFLVGLPTRADFSAFLKTVMGTAAYKFQHYSRMGTPQADGQARAWAKIGFDAGVRHDKFSATDVTDFSRAVQTAFQYEPVEIETIPQDLLSQVKPPSDDKIATQESLPIPPPLYQPEHEV